MTTPAKRNGKPAAKAAPAAATDRFASLTVTTAPPPKKKAPTPLPLPPAIRDLAAKLVKDRTPLAVSVQGWTEADLRLFQNTIRSNRATLFPEYRIRITPTDVDGKPALKLSLGKLGERKTAAKK